MTFIADISYSWYQSYQRVTAKRKNEFLCLCPRRAEALSNAFVLMSVCLTSVTYPVHRAQLENREA